MNAPDQEQTISIPEWFISTVAPRIREMAEMQVMLAFFRLQPDSRAQAEPLSIRRLLEDAPLRRALQHDGAVLPPDNAILRGIELATARESLLQFDIESGEGQVSSWLLLTTPDNRTKLERYQAGTLTPPELPDSPAGHGVIERTRPGVFKLYEQNIGLVTPIIADRLVEAIELYPQSWIEDAIEAAVGYNKRNWRYIQRILETWATEGRSHETNQRNQSGTGDLDPEKHLSGEYAAIFRRRRRE